MMFDIDLPGQDQDNVPQVKLEIDNVDRIIVDAIRAISTAATVDIEVVLASSPNTIEVGPITMTMRNIEYDALKVRATLVFEELFTEPYPGDSFTPASHPGLF
jgi:hypothetical protein